MKKEIAIECSHCHKLFLRNASKHAYAEKHGKPEYCSYQCAHDAKRNGQWLPCDRCGKLVYRTESQLRRTNGRVHCSASCATADYNSQFRRGKDSPVYVDGNRSYRTTALLHYGAVCECCGFSEDERLLDVHHIDENHNHNEIPNLMVLCPLCHARITRKLAYVNADRKIIPIKQNDREEGVYEPSSQINAVAVC